MCKHSTTRLHLVLSSTSERMSTVGFMFPFTGTEGCQDSLEEVCSGMPWTHRSALKQERLWPGYAGLKLSIFTHFLPIHQQLSILAAGEGRSGISIGISSSALRLQSPPFGWWIYSLCLGAARQEQAIHQSCRSGLADRQRNPDLSTFGIACLGVHLGSNSLSIQIPYTFMESERRSIDRKFAGTYR